MFDRVSNTPNGRHRNKAVSLSQKMEVSLKYTE